MDYTLAHVLASDMTQRLIYADNFFEQLKEFDSQKKYIEEYKFAISAAVTQRIPLEDEEWRLSAAKYISELDGDNA